MSQPRKRPPTLRAAVELVALNDATDDNDPPEVVAGFTTVVLMAELFGITAAEFADKVWKYRNPGKGSSAMNLRIEKDAVYDADALLGEFLDGRFVPSRLLLERPAAQHREVGRFVAAERPDLKSHDAE